MTLALTGGTLVAFGMHAVLVARDGQERPSAAFLVANPFVATADVVGGTEGSSESFAAPFTPIKTFLRWSHEQEPVPVRTVRVGADGKLVAERGPVGFLERVPFWLWSLLAYALLSVGSLWLAARRLRAPAERVA